MYYIYKYIKNPKSESTLNQLVYAYHVDMRLKSLGLSSLGPGSPPSTCVHVEEASIFSTIEI
jgi:hypothetical protein